MGKANVSVGWTIFWVIVFWPAALVYVLYKMATRPPMDGQGAEQS